MPLPVEPEKPKFAYQPPALETTISGPYGKKRLKNREGWGAGIDIEEHNGRKRWSVGWMHSGGILEVHDGAREDSQNNPGRRYLIVVDVCNTSEMEINRVLPKMLAAKNII